jgi:hypothetical protein
LKETKIIDIRWIKGSENDADVFTKNLDGPAFEKCIKTLVGQDVYLLVGQGHYRVPISSNHLKILITPP